VVNKIKPTNSGAVQRGFMAVGGMSADLPCSRGHTPRENPVSDALRHESSGLACQIRYGASCIDTRPFSRAFSYRSLPHRSGARWRVPERPTICMPKNVNTKVTGSLGKLLQSDWPPL
jgi:hypothetical protein